LLLAGASTLDVLPIKLTSSNGLPRAIARLTWLRKRAVALMPQKSCQPSLSSPSAALYIAVYSARYMLPCITGQGA
jgi:hypothetical protein